MVFTICQSYLRTDEDFPQNAVAIRDRFFKGVDRKGDAICWSRVVEKLFVEFRNAFFVGKMENHLIAGNSFHPQKAQYSFFDLLKRNR